MSLGNKQAGTEIVLYQNSGGTDGGILFYPCNEGERRRLLTLAKVGLCKALKRHFISAKAHLKNVPETELETSSLL